VSAVVKVITALERGGAQRVALETAARLHRSDRPVYLVASPGGALHDEATERIGRRRLEVANLSNALSPLGDVSALVELHRLFHRLREEHGGPVVVHTHSSKAGVLGRLAARAVPEAIVVHSVHGFGTGALGDKARPILEWAERVAGAATDLLLFVSEANRREADADGLAPRARRAIIRDAVDPVAPTTLEERERARAALGLSDDTPLAVTVGNLKPQKDPVFHAEVLAAWRRRRPDAHLLFLGDGPLREETEARARALGVDDAMLLPGFVPDPRPTYAAGDVFLLASAWEGLPCALLEAITSGLPAAVRHQGWGDDLGFTSRVVPRRQGCSAEDMADALESAFLLGRGVETLPSSFTFEGMLSELDALYDELIADAERD
jgi:glycosyltransferase involved in cell wall biosynthesis